MELPWQEPVKIPDGNHSGEITRIQYRFEPYEYTDVCVKIDMENAKIELKYGCPSILTENSKLGKLLIAMGAKFEKGKKEDPEKVLVGKRVTFMTLTKKSKKDKTKEYSEIVEDSIEPEVTSEKIEEK